MEHDPTTQGVTMNPDELDVKKLCMLADKPKSRDMNDRLVAEVKYDGHRIMMYRSETGVRTFARSGAEKSGLLRRAEEALMALPAGTWVDGEACSFKDSSELANDWGVAQSVLGSDNVIEAEAKITYVVFDMLSFAGRDMRSLPLLKRREVMEDVFATLITSDAVCLSTQWAAADVAGKMEAVVAEGGEGLILKDLDSTYQSGKRGRGWWKVKFEETDDFVVMGFTAGKNARAATFGAMVFGKFDAAGNLVEQGQCSGFNDAELAEIHANRSAFIGRVVEVKHNGVMPTGGIRHPQFLRFRTDKPAADCRI